MAQKNRLKKDNTERIARAQARKARNVAANKARHEANVEKLKDMAGVHYTGRTSKVLRTVSRADLHAAWLAAAEQSGVTPPGLYSTAEHLHIVAERAKQRKVAAAMSA